MKSKNVMKFAWLPKIIEKRFVFLKWYIEVQKEVKKELFVHTLSGGNWITITEYKPVRRFIVEKWI